MDFLFHPSQKTGFHGLYFKKHSASTCRDPLWPARCGFSYVATRHCVSATSLLVPMQISEAGPLRNGQKGTLRS